MMDYYSAVFILGIMFWVLLALGVVGVFAWLYIQMSYYRWDRELRQNESIIRKVQDAIKNELANDSQAEAEQYASDFESEDEYTA